MSNLAITIDEIESYYPGIDSSIYSRDVVSDADYVENFLPSKLWRLNNLYTIIDKDGIKVPFVMNKSQHVVYSALLKHPRLCILKSRQQGISTLFLILYLDDAVFLDNLNVGLMAQGKAEATTLLKRVKLAWENFPVELKHYLNVKLIKNNSEEFSFSNGSTLFIRTSFRSTTLQRLHISEFGKIANKYPERAKETKTGTLQAISPGNYVAVESTAEGDNDFKVMWDTAVLFENRLTPKDFLPVFLSWLVDDDCRSVYEQVIDDEAAKYFLELETELGITITKEQKNFWVIQHRELGDSVYQEYPSTPTEAFLATKNGTYYARMYLDHVIKRNRVIEGLYDTNLPVHVVMDLGMNDLFVLIFFQIWGSEWRIIDEYHNSGEGLEHYVNVMFGKNYTYGTTVLPHDIRVRELSTGQTRLHRLINLGIDLYRVLTKSPISDGIEAVRGVIPNLYIDKSCTYIISCLQNYTREWDDKLDVWKDKPLHNDFSHGADAVRGMAMSKLGNSKSLANKTEREKYSSAGAKKYISVVDGLAL